MQDIIKKTEIKDGKLFLYPKYFDTEFTNLMKQIPNKYWNGDCWVVDLENAQMAKELLENNGFILQLPPSIKLKKNEFTLAEELDLVYGIDETSLLLRYEYDKRLVDACLQFDADFYKNEGQMWRVSLIHVDNFNKVMTSIDESLALPEGLITEAKRRLEKRKKLKIKIGSLAELSPIDVIYDLHKDFGKWLRRTIGFYHPNEKWIRRTNQNKPPKYRKDLSQWDGRILPAKFNWNVKGGKLIFGVADVPIIKHKLEELGFLVDIDCGITILKFTQDTKFNLNLYDCQQRAIDHILTKFEIEKDFTKTPKSVMYQLPTGVGKTEVALNVIHKTKLKTIILVNRIDLLYQWKDRIKERLGIDAGIVGNGVYDPKDITVATVQSLWVHIKNEMEDNWMDEGLIQKFIETGTIEKDWAPIKNDLFKMFSLVIFDEVHVGGADTFLKVIQAFTAKYYLGQSATTWRTDGMEPILWGTFGKPEFRMPINDAVDDGIIVIPEVYKVKGIKLPPMNNYSKIVAFIVKDDERNEIIAKLARDAPKPCLILTMRLNHQKYIKDALTNLGIDSIIVNGKTKSDRRKEVLEMMKNQTAEVVISTNIWDEGVDIPTVKSLIMAFPTKSDVKVLQRIGRTLRKALGKNKAIIYDIVDDNRILRNQYAVRSIVYKEKGWLKGELKVV